MPYSVRKTPEDLSKVFCQSSSKLLLNKQLWCACDVAIDLVRRWMHR